MTWPTWTALTPNTALAPALSNQFLREIDRGFFSSLARRFARASGARHSFPASLGI
jgi:hypothetical protein